MTNEMSERFREEFYKEKCHYEDGDRHEVYENNPEDIADWWLEKLDLAVAEERKRIVEEVERMKNEPFQRLGYTGEKLIREKVLNDTKQLIHQKLIK